MSASLALGELRMFIAKNVDPYFAPDDIDTLIKESILDIEVELPELPEIELLIQKPAESETTSLDVEVVEVEQYFI